MKITIAILIGSFGVLAALGCALRAQPPQKKVKNIVLVHGAFADGSSWAKTIPILESRGFCVTAVQNPLTSLADDANATRRIIAQQDGPVILVGHSFPDVGMSAKDTSKPFGATPGLKAIQVDGQRFARMSEEGILNSFAEGLPMADRRLVLAVQGQIYAPMLDEKLTRAAWKSKPSWHVIAAKDRTLAPAMERAGAEKAGGKSVELPTCHVAMLQEPQQVADLITEAAQEAVKNQSQR
jgi:pimeloyl-ACP methyl ester carboxylesterase